MANPRALLPLFACPLLLLWLLLWLPLGASAQSPSEETAIRAAIGGQIEAFRQDDGGQAFSYASPGIRSRFGSAGNFMAMVRSGYPAVYRPLEVEFRTLTLENGRGVQEVYFIGQDGRAALALYLMERQPDGRWLIDGVRLVEVPETIS